MIQSRTKPDEPAPCDAQAISRWARVYAQNRSLGVVVFLMVFVLLSVAIAGTSFLGGMAYRTGNMLLLCASIAVLVPALAAVVYLSVPRWGGKLQERVVQRLYAKEGSVALSAPAHCTKTWGLVLAGCFGTCIIASVVAGFVYEIPSKYIQPISALYVVPFLVGLWFLMRPMAGCAALLWPALYAAHAILILAGAPILFTGPWDGLNMLIPVAGYGMLSGLVGHLYSRVALGRLKKLTRTNAAGDQPEEASRS
jgi:hypothetical protein